MEFGRKNDGAFELLHENISLDSRVLISKRNHLKPPMWRVFSTISMQTKCMLSLPEQTFAVNSGTPLLSFPKCFKYQVA